MRYLLSLSLLVLAFIANARQITPDEAQTVAQDFFNNSAIEQSRAPRAIRARSLATAQSEENAPYYIFNASDNKGFVIISGDTRARKIIGYSNEGNFDISNMPPQLSNMLQQYAESLSNLSGSCTDPSWTLHRQATNADGSILLKTANWGQGYPYNIQCPIIDGVQCPTGCVATAMAVVMKYHNWPEQGRNKWECTRNSIFHSVDFSDSKYDFSQLQNSYGPNVQNNESITNLSKLLYDCGVAASMFYNKDESGTRSDIIGHIMMRFFRYSPKCQHIYKRHFDESEWIQIIKNNITLNNPLIYFASSDISGHAFVIDGLRMISFTSTGVGMEI